MAKPMNVRRQTIERSVDSLLEKYSVEFSKSGPAVPVWKIASGEGNQIKKRRLEDDVSGFLLQKDGEKFIGVNTSQSQVRQRFTVAHELGHSLLHKMEAVHIDQSFRIDYRNRNSQTGTSITEREANLFAATLLMPEQFIEQSLGGQIIEIDDEELIKKLAKSYNVSGQAMTFRLLYLYG